MTPSPSFPHPPPHLPNVSHDVTDIDIDLEALLRLSLGPRKRSPGETYILILVYVLIFITGVVGNVCTCFVIVRNKRMHTATNYYLFSLAVSDLLTLLLGKHNNVIYCGVML